MKLGKTVRALFTHGTGIALNCSTILCDCTSTYCSKSNYLSNQAFLYIISCEVLVRVHYWFSYSCANITQFINNCSIGNFEQHYAQHGAEMINRTSKLYGSMLKRRQSRHFSLLVRYHNSIRVVPVPLNSTKSLPQETYSRLVQRSTL